MGRKEQKSTLHSILLPSTFFAFPAFFADIEPSHVRPTFPDADARVPQLNQRHPVAVCR